MSVRTLYHPSSRFGNNLFQYVVARLFAKRHGLRMMTRFTPANGNDILQVIPSDEGKVVRSPTIRVTDDPRLPTQRPKETFQLIGADQDPFSDDWPPARYIFEGWFEHPRWYHDRRADIEGFVLPEPIKRINTRDIVLNLRVDTDFMNMKWTIHPQWYLDILSREQFDRVHIVCDCVNEEYLAHFAAYAPVVVCSGAKGDWEYLRSFDRIVCSNSSFCWWACFFSKASKVYTFKRWHGYRIGNLGRFPNSIEIDGPFLHEGTRQQTLKRLVRGR